MKRPVDGGGRGHRRADEMGAHAGPLAADEVAVGGRGDALAGRPVSPLTPTHMEQPGSRQSKPAARRSGPGLRPRPASSRCRSPARPRPGSATLRPSATSAAARRSSMRQLVQEPMKTQSTGRAVDRRARHQAHVVERALQLSRLRGVGRGRRLGNARRDGDRMLGAGAPGDRGRDGASVEADVAVEAGAVVARHAAPVARRPRRTPRPSARRAGRRGSRRSCRRAPPCRPCRRARPSGCRG